mgnify:FL=1
MARKTVKRWENHQITGIGRREARTAFYKDSQSRISLNGEWKFNALGSGFEGGLEALCKNFGVNI